MDRMDAAAGPPERSDRRRQQAAGRAGQRVPIPVEAGGFDRRAGPHPRPPQPAGRAPRSPRAWDEDWFDAWCAGAEYDAAARPNRLWKPAFDCSVALVALVMLAPLFAMVALVLWLRDPGPLFYGHRRIGRGGRRFRCLKFRTMAVDGDAILARHLEADPAAAREWRETRKLRDDPRVTPIGRALRRSSLDELPQLLNILRGEMSLVGPRPIVEDEVHHYGDAMRDYLSVRPGLTGLWQVSGRNDVGYGERVRLDRDYARSHSFLGDLRIIARTVHVVLVQKGSY